MGCSEEAERTGFRRTLQGLPGLGNVDVSLRDGAVTFTLKESVEPDLQAIRKAICNLHFAPKELQVRVKGKLVPWFWPEEPPVEHPETFALKIEPAGQLFLLADPPDQRETLQPR